MAKSVYFSFFDFPKSMLYILTVFLFGGCSSENANDCLKSAGKTVETIVEVPAFTKIRTETDVRLVLKQGEQQRVVLQTGKNLVNDVHITVEDSTLSLRSTTSCNLVRDYGITKITVTAPNIKEVQNGSPFTVRSKGILRYPKLSLISVTELPQGGHAKDDGDFYMHVDCDSLRIVAGGSSFFEIKGKTNFLNVSFFDGQPRLNAGELKANAIELYHRAANKMIINPKQSLKGVITGTGDVISLNRPPIVAVEQRFTGHLIFKDQPN